MMHNGVVALIIIPLAGATLCMAEKGLPALRISRAVTCVAVLAVLGVLVALLPRGSAETVLSYRIGGFDAPFAIELRLDGIGRLGAAVSAIVAVAATAFSIGQGTRDPYYFALFLVMFAGMIGVSVTDDIFTMFIMFELVGIAAYALIAYGRKPEAVLASLRYLILTSVAMALYLFGVFVIYQKTGALSLHRLSVSGPGVAGIASLDRRTSRLVLAALVTGVATRAAVVPFHAWLPDAHANAPHGVSAMLSGAVVKVSFLALWRLIDLFGDAAYSQIFVWIGAATALAAAFQALAQSDAKKLLAWSTISQMGYVIAAYGVGTPLSRAAAGYYIVSHGTVKALLFLVVGTTLLYGGKRNLHRAGGFFRRSPYLFALFLVGALSLSGIPPFGGFAAKKLVLAATATDDYYVAWVLLRLAGVGTVASMAKLSAVFLRKTTDDAGHTPPAASRRRMPVLIVVGPSILAGLSVVTGVAPRFSQTFLYRLMGYASPDIVPRGVYERSSIVEAAAIALLGLVLYFITEKPRVTAFLRRIRRRRTSLDTATILLVCGFVALGGFALL